MADYYPLINRAIAGLDPSAPGEQRRALYERARSALIAQLRGVEPPLTESEITRERLSLEEAVRKVEAEAAQRARDASRPAGAAESKPRAGDAFRAGASRVNATPATPLDPRGRQSTPSTPSTSTMATPTPTPSKPTPPAPPPRERAPQEPRPRTLRVEPPPIPKQPIPIPKPPQPQPAAAPLVADGPPTRERSGTPRRFDTSAPPPRPDRTDKGDTAMRGFRDVTADVDDLGRAAAQANRAARKTYANVPSPTPEFDRLEPNMEDRGEAFGYDDGAAGWS